MSILHNNLYEFTVPGTNFGTRRPSRSYKYITSKNKLNYYKKFEYGIEYIVIHHTEVDLKETKSIFQDSARMVSSHYVISECGTLISLVDEKFAAHHAGVSFWHGKVEINHISIGIELVNDSYSPYTNSQLKALTDLLSSLLKKYDLPVSAIIGHSDIAPNRKTDPGAHFPWTKLIEDLSDQKVQKTKFEKEQNFFLNYGMKSGEVATLKKKLSQLGYDVGVLNDIFDQYLCFAIKAFTLRHLPIFFADLFNEIFGQTEPEISYKEFSLPREKRFSLISWNFCQQQQLNILVD